MNIGPTGTGVGASYARAKTLARRQYGTTVVIAGKSYAVRARKAAPADREFLPQAGVNAAFPSARVYEASPSDFSPPPSEGEGLTELGQAFTIVAVPPAEVVAGVPHTLLLLCYRTPAAPEVSAGQENIWKERQLP